LEREVEDARGLFFSVCRGVEGGGGAERVLGILEGGG